MRKKGRKKKRRKKRRERRKNRLRERESCILQTFYHRNILRIP